MSELSSSTAESPENAVNSNDCMLCHFWHRVHARVVCLHALSISLNQRKCEWCQLIHDDDDDDAHADNIYSVVNQRAEALVNVLSRGTATTKLCTCTCQQTYFIGVYWVSVSASPFTCVRWPSGTRQTCFEICSPKLSSNAHCMCYPNVMAQKVVAEQTSLESFRSRPLWRRSTTTSWWSM